MMRWMEQDKDSGKTFPIQLSTPKEKHAGRPDEDYMLQWNSSEKQLIFLHAFIPS